MKTEEGLANSVVPNYLTAQLDGKRSLLYIKHQTSKLSGRFLLCVRKVLDLGIVIYIILGFIHFLWENTGIFS
jgi:hypothetical protein